jgi:hypothetical protein
VSTSGTDFDSFSIDEPPAGEDVGAFGKFGMVGDSLYTESGGEVLPLSGASRVRDVYVGGVCSGAKNSDLAGMLAGGGDAGGIESVLIAGPTRLGPAALGVTVLLLLTVLTLSALSGPFEFTFRTVLPLLLECPEEGLSDPLLSSEFLVALLMVVREMSKLLFHGLLLFGGCTLSGSPFHCSMMISGCLSSRKTNDMRTFELTLGIVSGSFFSGKALPCAPLSACSLFCNSANSSHADVEGSFSVRKRKTPDFLVEGATDTDPREKSMLRAWDEKVEPGFGPDRVVSSELFDCTELCESLVPKSGLVGILDVIGVIVSSWSSTFVLDCDCGGCTSTPSPTLRRCGGGSRPSMYFLTASLGIRLGVRSAGSIGLSLGIGIGEELC